MTQFHLLRERRFAPLFWTQFWGAFNDNFLKNAMVMMVTFESIQVMGLPPSQIVALAGGIFILPFLLFSALAGQLADKYEKGKIILWVKRVEIGIMFLAALGFLFLMPAFLLIALFLMGAHSTFFGPIKYSILPQHLRIEELLTGNALVEAGTFTAILLGTIAGSAMILWPGGKNIVSAGLLIIAWIGYRTSLRIPVAAAATPELDLEFSPWRPTLKLFDFTREPASVFQSIIAISWFWFFGAVMLSVFPALCKDVLHADKYLVTVFFAEFSIGIACGSMLTSKISRGRVNLGIVFWGALAMTVFSALAAWLCAVMGEGLTVTQSSIWPFLADFRGWLILVSLLLFSAGGGMFIVPLYTLIQQRSAASYRSRVIAANNVMNALFMIVASVMLIVLLRLNFTVPQAIGVVSAMNLVVLLYIYRKLIRKG